MGIQGEKHESQAPTIKNHWLVYFLESRSKSWWDKLGLTRPGFRHVFGVQYNPTSNTFVLMDWTINGLDIVVLDSVDLHHLDKFASQYSPTVVTFESERVDFQVKKVRMLPMNCVSAMIHALKLGHNKIYTPYQLYKHLILNGGKEQ